MRRVPGLSDCKGRSDISRRWRLAMAQPSWVAMRAATNLVRMLAWRSNRAGVHRPSPLFPGSRVRPPGYGSAWGSRLRVGGVKSVDVGQQDQLVRLDHLRDAQAARRSLSPKRRFRRSGDGVVFIDDRNAPQAQQRVQRLAGVQIAATVLEVVQRQQQLRGGQGRGRTVALRPPAPERIWPTAGGAACFSSNFRASLRQAPALVGSARWRLDDTTTTSVPPFAQGLNVGRQRCPARWTRGAACLLWVDTTSAAADLDDDPLGGGDGRITLPAPAHRAVDGVLQDAQEFRHTLAWWLRTAAGRRAGLTLFEVRPDGEEVSAQEGSSHRTCSIR